MITRRAFLSALAALPVVGKWMPQPKPPVDYVEDRASGMRVRFTREWRVIESRMSILPDGCEFHEKDGIRLEMHGDQCRCAERAALSGREYHRSVRVMSA